MGNSGSSNSTEKDYGKQKERPWLIWLENARLPDGEHYVGFENVRILM